MKLIKLDEVDSTNNYMKENIEKFNNYDIVSAKNQTLGRGRRGNTWLSSQGMALFTFLLKPEIKLDMKDYIKLPLIAGISTLKALLSIEENDYKFKWTNDIFLKDKKLCGILIEKVEDNFIVGIGINVNNEIPKELENIAISLKGKYDIDFVIEKVVEKFDEYYQKFIFGDWENIINEINEYSFLKEKNIRLVSGNQIYQGKALNIALDGRLEVEINGELKLFNAGEIKIEKDFF